MPSPSEILEQLKQLTPQSIQEAIDFAEENIRSIKQRYQAEVDREKEEIRKLRRVAKLVGLGLEVDRSSGRAKVRHANKTHDPRPETESGGRLSDRIARWLQSPLHRTASFVELANHMNVSFQAIRVAVARSGARFEVEGDEVSLGRIEEVAA